MMNLLIVVIFEMYVVNLIIYFDLDFWDLLSFILFYIFLYFIYVLFYFGPVFINLLFLGQHS